LPVALVALLTNMLIVVPRDGSTGLSLSPQPADITTANATKREPCRSIVPPLNVTAFDVRGRRQRLPARQGTSSRAAGHVHEPPSAAVRVSVAIMHQPITPRIELPVESNRALHRDEWHAVRARETSLSRRKATDRPAG
jgi:hypothetical protein